MVKQNFIDLTEQFENEEENNDYVVLTTFTFDPIFFDVFVLKKLFNNNPSSEIIVLTDADQYEKAYEKFTSITGTSYHLLPMYISQGVFHPKIFLFYSEQKQKIVLYISSSNLTLPGLTTNSELVLRAEYAFDKVGNNVSQVLEILNYFCKKNFIRDTAVISIIDKISKKISTLTKFPEKNMLFHNLDKSISEKILDEIHGKEFEEMIIYAPFFSPNASLLEKILDRTKTKSVKMLCQKQTHNLADIKNYKKICQKNNVNFEVSEVSFKGDKSRVIHAKFIIFKGTQNWLFMGSPNFTEYALLRDITTGNFEIGCLVQDFDSDEVLSQLDIENGKFSASNNNASFQHHHSSLIHLYSVNFDEFERKIIIRTDPIDETVVIRIQTKDGQTVQSSASLKTGITEITIKNIPLEISIIHNNHEIRRRVFYDENLFFRKFSKENYSVSTIIKKITQTPNTDDESLLILLNHYLRNKKTEYSPNPEVKNKSTSIEKPHKSKSSSSYSDLFVKFLKIHHTRTQSDLSRKTEEISEDEKDQIEEKEFEKEYEEIFDVDSKIPMKILTALSDNLTSNINDLSEIVSSQALLLIMYQLIHKSIKIKEVDEFVLELLENNLKNISREQVSLTSRNDFLINYIQFSYDVGIESNYHCYEFLSSLFTTKSILSEKTFTALFKRFPNVDFGRFIPVYSSTLAWSVHRGNFTEVLIQVIYNLVTTESETFRNAMMEILKILKIRHFSISDHFWDWFHNPSFTIKQEYQKEILNILKS